jgi:type IV pilus secretin PilQ/predicted competence protein
MSRKITLLLGLLTALCVCIGPSHAGSPAPEGRPSQEEPRSERDAVEGTGNEEAVPKKVTVRVRSARVREEPSFDAAVEYGLTAGEIASVITTKGPWLHIEREDGKKGWAHRIIFLETYQKHDAAKKEEQPKPVSTAPSKPQTTSAQPLEDEVDPEPAESGKDTAQPQKAETESEIGIKSDNHLMCLNFIDVDIRAALSAVAMEREINISTAQDVSGKISVHLYHVSLKEALDAITRAGGFSYNKNSDLYYVYKPAETKDPQAERIQMRIFKLKYASIDKVQEILEAIPGMRTVKIHDPSKTIIVEDTPENIAKIEKVLSYWDKRPKQVVIEAKILEVELTDDMSFGVNWEQIMGDVRLGTGGFSSAVLPTVAPVSPVPAEGTGVFGNVLTGAGTNHQLSAALDALQTKTKINTLSTPRILALHGETAKVQVGGQQGYQVTTVDDGVQTQTIEFIDTGTILEITPHIDDDNNILLYVEPSINSASLQGPSGIPVVKTTTVTTRLLVKNGGTAFIGGLIQDTMTDTRNKIPVLGSIPLLGALFRRTSTTLKKTELVVLITPRILESKTELAEREDIEKTEKLEERFKEEPPPTSKKIYEMLMPMD